MEIRRSLWVKYNLFAARYSFFASKNPGWGIEQSLVLPACGIFQQEWEWDDSCRLAEQRQAGWERLRMDGTRVWNPGTRRDLSWEKRSRDGGCEGLEEDFIWSTSAPNPWHGKHDSAVLKTAHKNWCRKLPTSLCDSPAARRTTQQSCPSLGLLRGRHVQGGFKGFILSLSGWVTGLL